jgi:hypothetical protein
MAIEIKCRSNIISKLCCVVALVSAFTFSDSRASSYHDDPVNEQWFTGSLESPSPAVPKAGMYGIEPYAIYTHPTGAYDNNWNHHSVAHDISSLSSMALFKYGITDHLSIKTCPSFSYQWNDHANSRGIGLGDVPIELDYRVNEGNIRTGFPSVTFALGMSFPTGSYDHLHNTIEGLGNGAYMAKEGIILQSLFNTWENHPMRMRVWGFAYEPVDEVSVHDVSVYGTAQGFHGHATPGASLQFGIGGEYGLNRQWVLALDLVHDYADGFSLKGADGTGNLVTVYGASSASFAVAPAVEYNFTSHVGIIAGVEFSIVGRNTSSYIAPNVALNMLF